MKYKKVTHPDNKWNPRREFVGSILYRQVYRYDNRFPMVGVSYILNDVNIKRFMRNVWKGKYRDYWNELDHR